MQQHVHTLFLQARLKRTLWVWSPVYLYAKERRTAISTCWCSLFFLLCCFWVDPLWLETAREKTTAAIRRLVPVKMITASRVVGRVEQWAMRRPERDMLLLRLLKQVSATGTSVDRAHMNTPARLTGMKIYQLRMTERSFSGLGGSILTYLLNFPFQKYTI